MKQKSENETKEWKNYKLNVKNKRVGFDLRKLMK